MNKLIFALLSMLLSMQSLTGNSGEANRSKVAKSSMIESTEKEAGTVKWFNESKGYGFISQGEGPDIFVHYRDIKSEGFKTLTEGQKVLFIIKQGKKGPEAKHVVPQ